MSKKLKVLFSISLLLNCILISALGGLVMTKAFLTPDHFEKKQQSYLDPDLQEKLMKAMTDSREQTRPLWKNVREARQEMGRILSQDNFNEDQYNKALLVFQDARSKLSDARNQHMTNFFKTLPIEDRKALAEHFETSMERKRKP